MSKKKNDEEKEVKTEAENQEESKTDAEDNKAAGNISRLLLLYAFH